MDPSDVARATRSATVVATSLDLAVTETIVLQNSNKLSLRLLPCDVFARVGPVAHDHAAFEVDLATRLVVSGSPVVAPEPRVPARRYEHDGFELSLWTHHEPIASELSPAAYAKALEHLHVGMRDLDLEVQHVTDRVAEAQRIVDTADESPTLSTQEREFLAETIRRLRRGIAERGADEQVLHGEPHPGNVLHTEEGPMFVDLETCCRGPIEFDLAHVPGRVADHYPDVDHVLLRDCREMVLAMVAAWRFEPDDQLPDGLAFGRALLRSLHAGPPWPTIDRVHADLSAS